MAREFLDKLMNRWLFTTGARGRLGAVPSARAPKKLGTRACNQCRNRSTLSESGVSLIETMVAALILLIVVAGVLPVFILGFQTTEQQGDIATRTTEYAQDKMELLMNLGFTDAATNTTSASYPVPTIGGPGLGGTMAPSPPPSPLK